MKKISIYTIITILAFSCSDFLDLPKINEPSSGDYFKNTAQFDQLLTGAYQPLRNVYGVNGFIMGESRSDNAFYEYYPKVAGAEIGDRQYTCDFLDGNENICANNMFNDCYNGISKTNVIITRMSDVVPESDQNRILGEAYFLRALYYYNLVRFFGPVPVHKQEVRSIEEASAAKASEEEIFAFIVEDLEFASTRLQAVTSFPQTGNATKGAAYTLLGSVYLYQKQYEKALATLNKVEGYTLLHNYTDIYNIANKNNSESIFEVQFKEGSTEGQYSGYLYYMLPKSQENEAILGIAGTNNLLHGGYNVPTPDMLRNYETGDKRFNASIGVVEGIIDEKSGDFISKTIKEAAGYIPGNDVLYRYFCRKYLGPHSVSWQTANNWPVFRYADVLLMKAECLNETGKPADALPYLNEIRQRAGLNESSETDQARLRAEILQERRVELAFENHRWHDLVRTGNAITVMNKHGIEMKSLFSYLNPQSYTVTEARLKFAIPLRETIWNKEL